MMPKVVAKNSGKAPRNLLMIIDTSPNIDMRGAEVEHLRSK